MLDYSARSPLACVQVISNDGKVKLTSQPGRESLAPLVTAAHRAHTKLQLVGDHMRTGVGLAASRMYQRSYTSPAQMAGGPYGWRPIWLEPKEELEILAECRVSGRPILVPPQAGLIMVTGLVTGLVEGHIHLLRIINNRKHEG